eukprot:TRINITY_DN461_c0_g1_i3.p2 TRINITY_DN461_c0_g1~~TRINITY_DN461_c0_g1_i3.p2  ORF type:complete len:219 (+),score=88.78 TRINITY_DN461_c0_g1_i3:213-869(+)
MAFALPPLPYAYDALEPYIDSTTMNIHHTKHHNTYVTNVNNVLAGENGGCLKGLSLSAIQKEVVSLPDSIKTAVRNSGGGHWNHSFFWSVMGKTGSIAEAPSGDLKSSIESTFGSLDEMQKKFNTAAATRFGSGWAWLSVNADGQLFISSTPNQDNPLMEGIVDQPGTPILGLDVWEHAYYLKYQNRRPEYIASWWKTVDFDVIAKTTRPPSRWAAGI